MDLLLSSAFTLWGTPTTWLEVPAFALALAMVALHSHVNPLGWPLRGLLLDRCTDTDVPHRDAFPTTASIAGQWLLGRKYVQNWTAWLIVNTVSAALFACKDLWLTMLLYLLFVALSVAGWQAWRQLAAAPR